MTTVFQEARVSLNPLHHPDSVGTRTFVLSENALSKDIGRASKNKNKGLEAAHDNAYFDSPVMSREHGVFVTDGTGKTYIMDTKSMHGTFVDDNLLEKNERFEIKSGMSVKFGTEINRGEESFPAKAFEVGINYYPRSGYRPTSPRPHGIGYGFPTSEELILPEGSDYDYESGADGDWESYNTKMRLCGSQSCNQHDDKDSEQLEAFSDNFSDDMSDADMTPENEYATAVECCVEEMEVITEISAPPISNDDRKSSGFSIKDIMNGDQNIQNGSGLSWQSILNSSSKQNMPIDLTKEEDSEMLERVQSKLVSKVSSLGNSDEPVVIDSDEDSDDEDFDDGEEDEEEIAYGRPWLKPFPPKIISSLPLTPTPASCIPAQPTTPISQVGDFSEPSVPLPTDKDGKVTESSASAYLSIFDNDTEMGGRDARPINPWNRTKFNVPPLTESVIPSSQTMAGDAVYNPSSPPTPVATLRERAANFWSARNEIGAREGWLSTAHAEDEYESAPAAQIPAWVQQFRGFSNLSDKLVGEKTHDSSEDVVMSVDSVTSHRIVVEREPHADCSSDIDNWSRYDSEGHDKDSYEDDRHSIDNRMSPDTSPMSAEENRPHAEKYSAVFESLAEDETEDNSEYDSDNIDTYGSGSDSAGSDYSERDGASSVEEDVEMDRNEPYRGDYSAGDEDGSFEAEEAYESLKQITTDSAPDPIAPDDQLNLPAAHTSTSVAQPATVETEDEDNSDLNSLFEDRPVPPVFKSTASATAATSAPVTLAFVSAPVISTSVPVLSTSTPVPSSKKRSFADFSQDAHQYSDTGSNPIEITSVTWGPAERALKMREEQRVQVIPRPARRVRIAEPESWTKAITRAVLPPILGAIVGGVGMFAALVATAPAEF